MLYSMDLTVLNLAIPAISEALKPTAAQLLWIVDIYGFLVAGLLVTMGTLGDRIGRRRLLMIGAAAFGAASVLAALSHSAEMLIAARALPWAKLGVARAQIESGQAARAVTTLQELIGEDASFADAYDVLGRAQVELGNFSQAIETYRTASGLTPDSVVRLQKLGMMSYYMGDRETATKVLARAAILGIDSKLFDFQSLVLLTFSYF
eukprot:gene12314-15678_t